MSNANANAGIAIANGRSIGHWHYTLGKWIFLFNYQVTIRHKQPIERSEFNKVLYKY
jgi:hypothetical protein